jgi:hypothetical protein
MVSSVRPEPPYAAVGSHQLIGTTDVFSRRPDPTSPTSSRTWLIIVVGCLALATASLFVLPRGLAYDPWSWVIWGREVAHLDLDTKAAATAVKPLPIIVTTLLAPTGSLAPTLWLLISRTASLLALALVFCLGRRLGGIGAGVVAVVGLAISNQFLNYLFMDGMSEPMAAAAMVAAVDSHLQSRRRSTMLWLVVAALLRPEAWFFLLAYCVWLAVHATAWRRLMLAAVAFVVPSSWFVIDWFGSGHLLRSAGPASQQSQGGPLLTREPGLATVRETWHLMSGPFVVLFLLGLAAALLVWFRSRDVRPTGWLSVAALSWLVIAAAMAQARIATGAPRYLLPGAALACVVAGVFVADGVRVIVRLLPDTRVALSVVVLGVLGLGALCGGRFVHTGQVLRSGEQQSRRLSQSSANVADAIAMAGGRAALVRCGPISTQAFQVPIVAWQLRVPVGEVTIHPTVPGVVLQQARRPRIPAALSSGLHNLGSVGPPDQRWTVLTSCPATPGR